MKSLAQPAQHPLRAVLHNEVHARPPGVMSAPLAIAHIVMLADAAGREASRAHLAALLRDYHRNLPDVDASHMRVDLGPFRVRWELHTEFVSWTFTVPTQAQAFGETDPASALDDVPHRWLAQLPGECLCSMNLWVMPSALCSFTNLSAHVLYEETLVASSVAHGHAKVFTDFAIHADGSSRMVLLTDDLSPRALGRLVQRLLELETYRMAALMGLPAAREATSVLALAERELAALASAIRTSSRDAEPLLLDRLTRLAGQVEGQYAATHSRFSATSAYFELLDKRIQDISESRLDRNQTIREFIDRRLSPARATCAWAERRQNALSVRVSRMSNLLRTRVEIEQQLGTQALLESMNQRQGVQLQLQATVEGLSVAAITYYIVGLVSYMAKGGQSLGWPLSPETTAALAIPIVVVAVWCSLRRLHKRVFEPVQVQSAQNAK